MHEVLHCRPHCNLVTVNVPLEGASRGSVQSALLCRQMYSIADGADVVWRNPQGRCWESSTWWTNI
jgi:hypothetical protein